MKPIAFVGSALDDLRNFPDQPRRASGYQLDKVQRGLDPDDWKPMVSVGPGVRELRVRDETGAFRVVYIASLQDAVFVLHAFQKKTSKTSRRDLNLAASRFQQVIQRLTE